MVEMEVLQKLGLTQSEAKVYLALLELGPSLAGAVIKKTGLHRATTYQILQRLIEKGLVSSIVVGKKRHFEAAEPKRLYDVLKQHEEALKEILPSLIAKREAAKEKQTVTVFQGANGIRSVMDTMMEELGTGGKYLAFGVSGYFRELMPSYWDLWQKRKIRQKIKSYIIFNEALKKTNPKLLKDYFGQSRYHSPKFTSMTDTMIYRDTVVLFIWTAKPPIVVVIKSKENAKSYANQFQMMWKVAKK
jgi:sugar-specific transcriptional regulator TrmB